MNTVMNLPESFCGEERIDDWMRCVTEFSDSADGVFHILAMLGQKFGASCVFVMEWGASRQCKKSYEWTPDAGAMLKNEPFYVEFETICQWAEYAFAGGTPFLMRDVEALRNTLPQAYATLRAKGVSSFAAVSLVREKNIIGFLGIYDPDWKNPDHMVAAQKLVASFMVHAIRMRQMTEHVAYLTYHDPLTRCYNRRAYEQDLEKERHAAALGVVCCDIIGLKKVNENQGHEVANALIVRCADILRAVFVGQKTYRVSGDKYVIVCAGMKRGHFDACVEEVRRQIVMNGDHMAIGKGWANRNMPLHVIVAEAESAMLQDKIVYYTARNPVLREGSSQRLSILTFAQGLPDLQKYLTENYFNILFFLRSLSIQEQYVYFGDLRTNTFFITDKLKSTFGFPDNIVTDLFQKWESLIVYEEELENYRADVKDMIEHKRSNHDLRYRVRDRWGNEFWIRCSGYLVWDEKQETPLFFSGSVVKLEYEFIIDPLTDFPREQGAVMKLRELMQHYRKCSCIGFRLHNFREINELRGRTTSDSLLRDISVKLLQTFKERMTFLRLDGMRFMAVVHPEYATDLEKDVVFVKETIEKLYQEYGVDVRKPCSCGIMKELENNMGAREVIDDMLNLLDLAKDTPEESYTVYSQEHIERRKHHSRMMMDLNHDVGNDFMNFRPVVQPTVRTSDMRVHSGEMLLRWTHGGKDVSPGIFIPLLEQTRQILAVGRWVFEQAVINAKQISAYDPDFVLGVNVSYFQVLDAEFLPFMKATLDKWGVEGQRILVEITETNYNESPRTLQKFLESCKEMGIQLALDDFGTGYSSLELLLKHSSDIVKLDRSLMKEMSLSRTNNDFITAIVYACHKFGKKVCVEGVETDFELNNVLEADCDYVQGFYFYRPMELADFYELLANDSGGAHKKPAENH